MPIRSAKGEISMDKFLKSFYNDHFANRENNNIGDTEEYKKRSECHEQILKQIYIHLSEVLPANESIGLLNDYDDAMFLIWHCISMKTSNIVFLPVSS